MSVDMRVYVWQILWSLALGIPWGLLAVVVGCKELSPKDRQKVNALKVKIRAFFRMKRKTAESGRKKITHIARIIIDSLFGVVSGVAVSIFAYATNDGVLRWFSVLTLIASAGVTAKFLCCYFHLFLTVTIYSFGCITEKTLLTLMIPLRKLAQLLLRILKPLYLKAVLIFRRFRDRIISERYQSKKKKELRLFLHQINKEVMLWQKK